MCSCEKSGFLANKLALVTGAGSGIGKVIACELAKHGARLILTGRNYDKLKKTAAEIESMNFKAKPVSCDLTLEEEVNNLFAKIEEMGNLDILINNAGCGIFSPIVDATAEEWHQVMNINAFGAFLCSREAMRRMKQSGGRIINISSAVGLKGYKNQGIYTASKHALMGLTKVMAIEGQEDNIIVQVICPGGVDTEMVQNARPDLDRSILMLPQDIANTVIFLLRQQGNAITDMISLRRKDSTLFSK